MARDTIYKLYKTGKIDPTYTNIWAFSTAVERDNWLNSKASLEGTFTNIKYWRVGESIKIPIRYEMAFEYDYIKISNDTQDAQLSRDWYCFITARAYISPSVTLLTLAVDYVQTFYFTNGLPFWRVNGFVTQSTSAALPPVGTPPDYPVPNTKTEWLYYESSDYAIILYATMPPDRAGTSVPSYVSGMVDGVPMASVPYVLYHSTPSTMLSRLATTIDDYNTHGWADTISGIYLVPSDYVAAAGKTGYWVSCTTTGVLLSRTIQIAVPSYALSLVEYTNLITQYGYFNFVINNGQGETLAYNFNEFDGAPTFELSVSVTAGSPVLMCRPVNLKYNQADFRNRIIKITQAPAVGWLNDSYKIWLAQTQNSRAAAIDGANLSIAQAKEARDNSWAYKYGTQIKALEDATIPGMLDAAYGVIDKIGGINKYQGETGGLFGKKGISIFGAANPDHWAASYMKDIYGIDTTTQKGESVIDASGLKSGLATMTSLGISYLNNQLGIETTYQYDQRVASAEQNLKQLLASYQDKARIPATARGSNAYGDVTKYKQYGFMFTVYGPDNESLSLIYNMIKSGGASTNRYMQIEKWHNTFDFVSAASAKILADASTRPEFVRKLMLDLLQSGVYLWYVQNGDISSDIGSPYGVTNEVVTNG